MMNNRRSNLRRTSALNRRTRLGRVEFLEEKLPLDASGFAGNDCPPDLDFSQVGIQIAQAGQEISFDLFNVGATVTDLNSDDSPTNDNIILQLDPDETPAGATLTSDGQFSWTPPVDATGRFEFVVIAIDEGTPFLADAEIMVVEIPVPNTAPDLADIPDQTATVGQELQVTLNATDAAGSNLIFQIDPETQDLQAIGATLEQNGTSATLRWTPDASFAGQTIDFIALVVDDGTPPLSDSERFSITVDSVTVANDDSFAATVGTDLIVDAANGVLANDTSGAGSLTASLVDQATQGTVTLAADGSFFYVADSGASGTDSFTYQVNDGSSTPVQATVTINLSSPPVSVADAYTTDENTTLTVDAANGVLSNDTDADGDTLSVTLMDAPATGNLTLNADGSFEYVPATNENGDVTFTYMATDGNFTSDATTVTISINSVNNAPVAVDDSFTGTEDTLLGVSIADGLLANDTDADGDSLTVTLGTDVANGTLTLSNDGSFTYLPNADFSGSDSFTYTVSDGTQTSPEATVTIDVSGVNDPPFAAADNYTIAENATLVVAASEGVLANDTDPEGDSLTAALRTSPFQGSVSFNPDGSFEYTPDPGLLTGGATQIVDSITYRANDGTVDSNLSIITITITAVNEAPVGQADTYSATEDVTLTVDAANGVLANDSDADGDTLTVAVVQNVTEGTLTLNADGSFSYDAAENSSGTDQFTYEISDGTTTSQEITVTLNVTPVNDAPLAVNDTFDVAFDATLNVAAPGVLVNDTDAEGDSLSASLVSDVSDGTLTFNADGSFTYEADPGFTGNDSFTYEISDGESTGQATVEILVTGDNEFAVAEGTAVGTVVGSVVPMTSEPAIFQFAQTNLNSNLLLDETDHLSGNPAASAVLIEYLDFGCPACADAHPVLEQLKADFPDDLLVVQRHFPVITQNSEAAARVAEAAARQGMFDEMAEVLFDNQDQWVALADPTAEFNQYAMDLGLDMTQFAADIVDADLATRVADDEATANTLNLSATPSYFLNGDLLDPAPADVQGFTPIIQAAADTGTSTYAINRLTGEITVTDNANIRNVTLNVLVTDQQGNTETVPVTINATPSDNGVASGELDEALASELDWLS